jgi:ATP-dependent Clp protease protease subunit
MIIQKERVSLSDCEAPVIHVTGFSMDGAASFSNEMRRLNASSSVSDIFISINSYGGEVWPMLCMIEEARNSPKRVHSICSGLCASAGAMLFSSVPGNRYISSNAQLMFHNIIGGMRGSLPELEEEIAKLKVLSRRLLGILGKRLAQSSSSNALNLKEFMAILKDKGDWYVSANKAVSCGLADKVGIPYFTKSVIVESTIKA